ncbi:hypothetical protein AGDE_02123 [Angomonas deanei]|nr:hypothetical protein AGDE_02123 [Angomonas deanei]|eukprot:EPY41800.1 hypothetical protein AGDE_02123 [Angomonas deanei]
MLSIHRRREEFEANKVIHEAALLRFKGVDGWDVYNCSVPFLYNGKRHIYGRVERREEWANSHVRLFVETGKDEFTALPDCLWELEDPYVQVIKGEFIFGGTHVRKNAGEVLSYYGYFYRGTPEHLTYFTTGPNFMKDIRVVELQDGRVGVFSRRRDHEEVYIGFCTIDSIEDLSMEAISDARRLDVLEEGTWGGVNQAYRLESGKIGCIAHYSYHDKKPDGMPLTVYTNYAFVLDPETREILDGKIIGSMNCYPPCPAKIPKLEDCVFTGGMVLCEDGTCDLYSGIGDTGAGRIRIDYPFAQYGKVVSSLDL